jgi:hypothetical protein
MALAPVMGTFRSEEILGHHLGADVLRQLASGPYRLEGGLSGSVTRITLPPNLSAADELSKLQGRFPDAVFGLNFLYRSYRPAGEEGVAVPPAPPAKAGAGCDTARCYGPNLIGWRPELAACARSVVVGIIDTAFDQTHSAVKGLSLIQHPADKDRRSNNWHGTGVAALLAGASASSTPGLIPEAEHVVVDAFYSSRGAEGSGSEAQTVTDTDHLVWALETLQEKHAQVVNMSLVGPRDPAIHAEISKMARRGVVFVAAAGNGGPAAAEAFPAAYQEVIAVTAIDRNKHGYAEANHGAYIDVAAPGVRVWTALPGEGQGFLSGTSFAAPFVTAIAAATYNATPMKTAAAEGRRALNPKDEVLARMGIEKLGGGGPGARDRVFGWGLVQAPANCAPARRAPMLASGDEPANNRFNPQAAWQPRVFQASSKP